MQRSFLDYAMSVIVARALPDVRDGLKPVHRRILWGANEEGVRPPNGRRKSAYIVGSVLGKYHPHSDTAVYDAMVRLGQDFASLPPDRRPGQLRHRRRGRAGGHALLRHG